MERVGNEFPIFYPTTNLERPFGCVICLARIPSLSSHHRSLEAIYNHRSTKHTPDEREAYVRMCRENVLRAQREEQLRKDEQKEKEVRRLTQHNQKIENDLTDLSDKYRELLLRFEQLSLEHSALVEAQSCIQDVEEKTEEMEVIVQSDIQDMGVLKTAINYTSLVMANRNLWRTFFCTPE